MTDALLFHAHHAHFQDDLPYWFKLAQQYGDPILELGCGTGRVCLPLAEAGYKIIGIDNDLDMLLFAKKQINNQVQSQLHLIQADMREFSLHQKYNLIISPCNTLSTLPFSALKKTILNIYQQMKTSASFAVSLPNPYIFEELPEFSDTELEDEFIHPVDGEPVQVSNRWVLENDQITFYWYYDHLLSDGSVIRTEASTTHYLFSTTDYIEIFREIGFSDVQLFGDYSFTGYSSDSAYLNILAVK